MNIKWKGKLFSKHLWPTRSVSVSVCVDSSQSSSRSVDGMLVWYTHSQLRRTDNVCMTTMMACLTSGREFCITVPYRTYLEVDSYFLFRHIFISTYPVLVSAKKELRELFGPGDRYKWTWYLNLKFMNLVDAQWEANKVVYSELFAGCLALVFVCSALKNVECLSRLEVKSTQAGGLGGLRETTSDL